jgi:hypothetical protein
MYAPLVKAFNYALDQLSELYVPGLPEFEEKHQIVFACSDAKWIMSEDYLHGSYNPDIILVKWDVFKKTQTHKCCLLGILRIQHLFQIWSRPAHSRVA